MAARWSTPCARTASASCPTRSRASERPRACSSGRATRRSRSGRCWPTSRRCRIALASARPAWTCIPSSPAWPTWSGWRPGGGPPTPPPWAAGVGPADTAAWGGEAGAADALLSLDPARDRIVSYVGKLIVSKGVDLLLAAWPLVVERVSEARLCVVGFGTYRDALHRLAGALATGDLDDARQIAAHGRELEGGPAGELAYLAAFL